MQKFSPTVSLQPITELAPRFTSDDAMEGFASVLHPPSKNIVPENLPFICSSTQSIPYQWFQLH